MESGKKFDAADFFNEEDYRLYLFNDAFWRGNNGKFLELLNDLSREKGLKINFDCDVIYAFRDFLRECGLKLTVIRQLKRKEFNKEDRPKKEDVRRARREVGLTQAQASWLVWGGGLQNMAGLGSREKKNGA